MQDKHFLFTRKDEDRDIFINKVKYPKTIFHVGNNPLSDEIQKDPKFGFHTFFAEWVIENYNNLPEYVVVCQSDPFDHVHEPLLAIDATFTSDFGSLCYARSLLDQYSIFWEANISMPLRTIAHAFGHGFINDNNVAKNMYVVYPGEVVFISRKRLLEKPISFYKQLIEWDNCDYYFQFTKDQNFPQWVYDVLRKKFPHIKNKKDLIAEVTKRDPKKTFGHFGLCLEALWLIFFSSKEQFKMLEKSQAVIGNKLYFNTYNNNYDIKFNFDLFPFKKNNPNNRDNIRLLENDWFDWNCPYYLKWREKLIEKTIWECERLKINHNDLFNYFKQIGYKHISL